MNDHRAIPMDELLTALLDNASVLNPRYLYRLSDLEGEELLLFEKRWPSVPPRRRQTLLEDLEELTERDLLLSYEAVSRVALRDEDAQVRLPAVRILAEFETPDLIPVFIKMCASDPEVRVRAAAASALGRYIYMGEVDKLPQASLEKVVAQLLSVFSGEDQPLVRRRALESLGYSGHQQVPKLIERALAIGDDLWVASALFAMGRSADESWAPIVLEMLDHIHPQVRLEAVRAAGELEVTAAVPALLDLLEDGSETVHAGVIWSLSQIGGQGVRAALEAALDGADDDIEARFIEDALDNLAFTEGFDPFALLDFNEEDLDLPLDDLDTEDFAD